MGNNHTRDASFQFIYGDTELNSNVDSTVTFYGMIHNLSEEEVVAVTILRSINNIPQSWNSSICVGMTCYHPSTDSISIEISAGDSTRCGLSIQISGQGDGAIQMNLSNFDDASQNVNVDISINANSTVNIDKDESQYDIIEGFILQDNYPNPFNPVTTISYVLEKSGMVNLSIYDMRGRLIKTLSYGNQNLGYHAVDWNGTDGEGRPVSAGSYLYTIKVENQVNTKKMTLLK